MYALQPPDLDAATRGFLEEKIFLEISQNSQESTVPESLF